MGDVATFVTLCARFEVQGSIRMRIANVELRIAQKTAQSRSERVGEGVAEGVVALARVDAVACAESFNPDGNVIHRSDLGSDNGNFIFARLCTFLSFRNESPRRLSRSGCSVRVSPKP